MNAEEIVNAVDADKMSVHDGIAALVQLGHAPQFAEEMIFIQLGGDDIIETDAQGIDRYFASGKTVEEVDRRMRNHR